MAVSNTADLFFQLWNTFLFLGVLIGAFVFAVMGFLLVKYRAKDSTPEPEDVPVMGRLPAHRGHVRTLLVSVTLSTIILSVLIFGTFSVIDQISSVPPQCNVTPSPCMRISAVGERFFWTFYYNGTGTGAAGHPVLRVPTGKTVILDVTSVDVVHNLTIIEYKIKTDAVPGRTNTIWFNSTETGTFRIQCFELCGNQHWTMYTSLFAMDPTSFANWFRTNNNVTGA